MKFFENNAAKNGTYAVSGKNTVALPHYYYTINEPRPICYTYHTVQGWRLVVNYYDYSQKKKSTRTKRRRAEFLTVKFAPPTHPRVYVTENVVLAMATEFRMHVEDVVQGGRPSRSHSSTHIFFPSPQTITIIQANKERAARTVGWSLIRRRTQRRLKAQKAQEQRCTAW